MVFLHITDNRNLLILISSSKVHYLLPIQLLQLGIAGKKVN